MTQEKVCSKKTSRFAREAELHQRAAGPGAGAVYIDPKSFLLRSEEGISTNILSDRLKTMVKAGLLSRTDDPTHRQKGIYSLTEMAISLVPILAHLGAWGCKYLPASEPLSIRAALMEEGGPALSSQFMDERRAEHLEDPEATLDPFRAGSVRTRLQAAYEEGAGR